VARILAIGTECDLALLTVDDDSFWADVAPIVMGKLPRLQDQCTVVGFPIGGDTISVTAGVASRVEMTPYAHSSSELLAVQIDAAINSGNSGGPVFDSKGLCVGVAFQSLKHEDAENIGYVIPVPVIEHFLGDYDRFKKYTGFPSLGLEWQKVESVHLRRALGLPRGGAASRRCGALCLGVACGCGGFAAGAAARRVAARAGAQAARCAGGAARVRRFDAQPVPRLRCLRRSRRACGGRLLLQPADRGGRRRCRRRWLRRGARRRAIGARIDCRGGRRWRCAWAPTCSSRRPAWCCWARRSS
jgi:hypothetical protein